MSAPDAPPTVHLVGAGPGGVGSLTRRAARLLRHAEVVVLDRPSLDPIAGLAPASAERVHVGRRPGHGARSTAEVVALLVERARAGLAVVRLKGGDPFVCSRGAEEALALAEAGITVDVTPGVTAVTVAGGTSGLDRGTGVTVASGNYDPAGPVVDWGAIGASGGGQGAIVVLTGRSQQGTIADGLVAGGRPAANTVVVVHGAARTDASVTTSTLAAVGTVRLAPPAAMVVAPSQPGRRPPASDRPGGERAHP